MKIYFTSQEFFNKPYRISRAVTRGLPDCLINSFKIRLAFPTHKMKGSKNMALKEKITKFYL